VSSKSEKRRPAGAKARTLNRGRVLEEALALLDREGVQGLTIRKLADQLGVTPMAIYNHVADKKDLLETVAKAVIEGAQFAQPGGEWHERIRNCFRELRRVCLAHPSIIKITQMPGIAPTAVFHPMHITLAALEEIGLSHQDAMRAHFLLLNFVLGQVSYEVYGPYPDLDPANSPLRGNFSDEEAARIAPAVQVEWDFDAAFEFGLSVILGGLNALHSCHDHPTS
jgi:TetR/AcrR family transcriptional regulator, tetracycline repressor protein